uniref:Uncharacterized protein n=1 Tax=Candidatus Kentrum sp. DK TaxID=2126562 RepID=A0A450S7D9_9GAMM|nr:MAG: hypothetical protein BECKDK2373C_GA0170839_101918 [Candidatus Kentron sp. DK]
MDESNYEEPTENGYGDHSSTYATTRLTAQLISFISWGLVAVSILIALIGISEGGTQEIVIVLFSIVSVGIGLFLVISGQLTRTVVDNADNSEEILVLLRKIATKIEAL